MSKPQYRYAHQQERDRWRPVVESGRAYCAEPICVLPSRWIAPGTPWDLSHDVTGTHWIGPSHARCNRAENARRNKVWTKTKRAKGARRWKL